MGVCAVRDVKTVRCFSPNRDKREAFAAAMSAELGVEIVPVGQPEDAIKGADIAMCATNSLDPVFFARWIEPGMHLSSIKRPEIEVAAVKRADRVVIHTNDPSPLQYVTEGLNVEEAKEGRGWAAAGEIDFKSLPTLPALCAGQTPSRSSDAQVTCFINNIGIGYQFAAAGAVVYRKAKETGLGHDLPTDWFTEVEVP
jgi:ornithine cyclodeaminase/alanine dehydrogenase-like protein (mu-crystallin family)